MLRFEIFKMPMAIQRNKFSVLFIIILGILSFRITIADSLVAVITVVALTS